MIVHHAARQERKRISMQNLRFTRRQDKIPSSTSNPTGGKGSSIPALYYKYVYVQDMVSADHSLKESLPAHCKMVAPGSQLHDILLIRSQLSFKIGARMFYCSNNLTNRPHGSSLLSTKLEVMPVRQGPVYQFHVEGLAINKFPLANDGYQSFGFPQPGRQPMLQQPLFGGHSQTSAINLSQTSDNIFLFRFAILMLRMSSANFGIFESSSAASICYKFIMHYATIRRPRED
jgi:hypothetical protein